MVAEIDGSIHLSLTHSGGRHPYWEEMLSARWSLVPADKRMVILIPNTPDEPGQVKSFTLNAMEYGGNPDDLLNTEG